MYQLYGVDSLKEAVMKTIEKYPESIENEKQLVRWVRQMFCDVWIAITKEEYGFLPSPMSIVVTKNGIVKFYKQQLQEWNLNEL